MTPARWQQVKELFDAAMSRTPAERARLLDEACADDEALRREVEILLASHERAESFMETPAVGQMAEVISTDSLPTLAAGASVGHYRIVKPIGAGGMGEVYLAEDVRLNRRVALKILLAQTLADKNARRRFAQEARAASALNHPHIVTIYDVESADDEGGRNFIAMELVEGKSLAEKMRGAPLPSTEIVNIAAQIADALDAAHAAGIMHRDIKPSNIMFTTRGQVKILDFGLAKLTTNAPSASSAIVTQPKTETGAVFGTVAYMSPEQALGQKTDTRTDIFSFGVVLYEMLTGRRPFDGDTASDTIDRIAHAQPEAIARFNYDAPPELERITRKCLEKERERRYQTARELVIDLQNLQRDHLAQDASVRESEAHAASPHISRAAGIISDAKTARVASPSTSNGVKSRRLIIAAGVGAALIAVALVSVWRTARDVPVPVSNEIRSLAVLPLVNSGGDAEKEYLADGITESLINRLSQLPNLKIMSRNTVFRFKGKETDAQKVAQHLGVRAVMTGNVEQIGEQLVINIELIDASDGSLIWTRQYIQKSSDVIAMQTNIAQDVVDKLRLKLSGAQQQQLAKHSTENAEAYQLYLRGRFYWNKRTEEGVRKGIEYFNQALGKDPNYALAYAGLADSYSILAYYSYLPPREGWLRAKEAAVRALDIDEQLAEAHTSLIFVRLHYDWDWLAAEKECKRAIELNPNSSIAHHFYSHYFMAMSRTEESLAESKRALELDPLDLPINAHLGWHYVYARRYDQAVEQLRKVLEMEPSFVSTHLFLGQAYEQKGMYEESIIELRKARDLSGGGTVMMASLGHAYAVADKKEEAQKALDELQQRSRRDYVAPYDIALIYTGLGKREQAFAWLEKAYEDRSNELAYLKVDPKLDSLRADPRFQDLLRRVGLPQ